MPYVQMVVVNYRTPQDLSRFCDSLMDNAPTVEWALTVVNVEARDVDKDEWEKIHHRFRERGLKDRINCFHITENCGYARACNFAAKMAEGRDHGYLAFFNADVALTPQAVDSCVAAMEANLTWGVLGPRQINERGQLTHAGIFGTHAQPRHRAWQYWDAPEYQDTQTAITVSGAAYFVRRSTWDTLSECPTYRQVAPSALGAFLPTPHYYEETWCSYHADAHGWKVIYFGRVCVLHSWHKASPVGGWAEQQFPESRRIFRQACDVHGIQHD